MATTSTSRCARKDCLSVLRPGVGYKHQGGLWCNKCHEHFAFLQMSGRSLTEADDDFPDAPRGLLQRQRIKMQQIAAEDTDAGAWE